MSVCVDTSDRCTLPTLLCLSKKVVTLSNIFLRLTMPTSKKITLERAPFVPSYTSSTATYTKSTATYTSSTATYTSSTATYTSSTTTYTSSTTINSH
ncbi:hypothetical protein FHG87_019537 [Trinorchestia longiramus]|nr:hypothetical protein FHG87_019537 [Trinorchestia longiramus]